MKFLITEFALLAITLSNSLFAQWATIITPGVPRTANGEVNLFAPTPHTADGRPDFSGVYHRVSSYDRNIIKDGSAGVVQPWADALSEQRLENIGKDNPAVLCMPEGPMYINSGGSASGGMVRIVQNPGVIALLHPDLTYRMIFMDGRKLEDDPNPSWMGYSVGRWDGDTLVVDSNGYNAKTWLDSDGHPHSEALKVTERYRRKDFGHIEIEATYVDPSIYSKPWTIKLDMQYAPDTELIEFVCSETKIYGEHLVGKASEEKAKEVTVDPKILAKYVGHYKELDVWNGEPVLRTIEVTTADGKLYAAVVGKPKYQLTAQSENMFTGFGAWGISFVFDDKGGLKYLMERHVSGDYRFTPVQ